MRDLRRGDRRRDTRIRRNIATTIAEVASLHPDDFGFDQDVVRAADHDEMFGVVAAHDDQLALAVQIERIDDAEPCLTRTAARHAQTAAEQHPDDEKHQKSGDEERDNGQTEHSGLATHECLELRHDRL